MNTNKEDQKRLNLGCGGDIRENWISLDKYDGKGIDVVFDLDSGERLPFEDDSFVLVYAENVLEHLYNYEYLIKEVFRILKPDGVFEVIVPHWSSSVAHAEWHVRCFRWYSFKASKDSSSIQKRNAYNGFEVVEKKILFKKKIPLWWFLQFLANKFPKVFEDTCFCRLFPAEFIHFKLRKTEKYCL